MAAQESQNGEVVPFYLTPVAYFEEYDLEHNMLFHSSLTPLINPIDLHWFTLIYIDLHWFAIDLELPVYWLRDGELR